MWDGIFYMDIASYKSNFSMTTVNQDTTGWNLGYYLKTDDTVSSHTLTVTNNHSSA